ncbi:glutamate receptor 2.8-like isoform X1 [Silene latifolia]|uniref:glutamate receptor 2.8-like isoform X1 n=1 Tax=Silene latifolia TaxID=37657 RepID=UPI003D77B505
MMKILVKCNGRAFISICYYLLLSYWVLNNEWLSFVEGQAMEVKVGVVIDKESLEGKVRLSCINMAISDWYADHPDSKTKVGVHVRDSYNHHPLAAADAVVDLIKNERVAAIIGPETSEEAQFAVNLGESAQVPIVSYSATSPFISPSQNPYFIRATQDDSSQVHPLTDFIQAFRWRQVVPVYVDDEFGGGIIPFLADALQQIGTRIPYRSVMPSSASKYQILAELYRLKSLSCRVFIVHMPSFLGSQLFIMAQELGMMSQDYVWIITNAMGNVLSNVSPQVLQAMQGVVGLESYLPQTKELQNFTVRWKLKFQQENPTLTEARLDVYGFGAYDATVALARAVEQIGPTNFTFRRADNAANLSTDIATMGVSQVGPKLLQQLLRLRFKGLSGNFTLSDGEIQDSSFRFINIRNGGKHGIGYWTPSGRLVPIKDGFKHATSVANLETIKWPGDPTSIPRGWVSSPNGKTLKIGVPIKDGFKQFVQVTHDVDTNKTNVAGFCIDVFDAVMSKLPYSVPYEYIPYTEHHGKPTESYDNLVFQVYEKKFDAVVGDITIRANRSTHVDFVLPFSESGVIMIAPLKDKKKIRAWLFVKPLTWDLWVTTFCFFIFIAFVVWILEHRINEDFRGPPGHQAGTSLYYSFSTMVFSHSFSVFSNLTRFVVIIWVFVLLLLTQSYTASLTSLLTVQQLQPTITDVKELIKHKHNVAYQEGSFVGDLLVQMKFNRKNLYPFNTTEQLHLLLSKGTANGGVSAAFDEIPYLKLFMGAYCSKYTMVQPTYKTDGFGFAFPKGSPLVSDVSRGVLIVTEGKEMTDLENKWLQTNNCPDSTPALTSSSLGLDSFWGLFTMAGAAALSALLISLAGFLKEHKSVWSDTNLSVWTRITTLFRVYDQKNLSSHTFKKSQAGTASNTPYLQSPSSYWDNSERGFNKYIEQQTPTPSPDNMDPSSSEQGNREGGASIENIPAS